MSVISIFIFKKPITEIVFCMTNIQEQGSPRILDPKAAFSFIHSILLLLRQFLK